jgi:hypothetical protein
MSNRFLALGISLIAVGIFSACARAQQGEAQSWQPTPVYDKTGENSPPAPTRDISGIWIPAQGPQAGIQANGAAAMPSDGKPEHELPYTPLGRQTLQEHKPVGGVTKVSARLSNDPVPGCDPQGFPRVVLDNFRTSRIIQTPDRVVILYDENNKWRMIWMDGRKLPDLKDNPEPTFWGYSVGKWTDDHTFVVESNGFDVTSWLDHAGRPHSDALHVTEEYKRTDQDHLVLTVTIDDPKMYTKPWVALKLPLRLQAPGFTLEERQCSLAEYNKFVGTAVPRTNRPAAPPQDLGAR